MPSEIATSGSVRHSMKELYLEVDEKVSDVVDNIDGMIVRDPPFLEQGPSFHGEKKSAQESDSSNGMLWR